VVFSQSELLQKEVFLVETVDSPARDAMTHLKAVCFLRPTAENMQHLKRILGNPRFGEYHLCKIVHLHLQTSMPPIHTLPLVILVLVIAF
jgi:vacuolar protein sorting-associated protein 45